MTLSNFKPLVLLYLLLQLTTSLFGQCDCDKVDQKNGTYYKICKPFISSIDSSINLKMGISGLGQFYYFHLNFTPSSDNLMFNSALTIKYMDSSVSMHVLIQRNISKSADSTLLSNGLFVIEESLSSLETKKVKSVSFFLNDNSKRVYEVRYSTDNIQQQFNCVKND